MKMNSGKLLDALKTVQHPKTGRDVVTSEAIQSASINGDMATITLAIDPADADEMEAVRQACEAAALTLKGVKRARAIMTAQRAPQQSGESAKPARPAPPKPKPFPGIKKIIAVASGKGGVGKSTTSVNLAFAMQAAGKRVAYIDCDVYGPSAALLLGLNEKPQPAEDNRMRPIFRDGLAAISMSFLVDANTAAVWRGPVVMRAVQQFLTGVVWDERGEIDVAVIDLPPGTGDVQLTLAQTAIVDGAIIVSTPQDLALIDARKAVDMFNKTGAPILGIVENMSYFTCPRCGERSDIFGHGGARESASDIGVPFLGEIPLHMDIRKSADAGAPIVLTTPDSEHAACYRNLAAAVLKAIH